MDPPSPAPWPAAPPERCAPDVLRPWLHDALCALADREPGAEILFGRERGDLRLTLREGSRSVAEFRVLRVADWMVSHLKKLARLDVAEKRVAQRGEVRLDARPDRPLCFLTAPGAEGETVLVRRDV